MTEAQTELQVEEGVASVTPAGIEVYYSWAPKRLYRVRQREAFAGCQRRGGVCDCTERPCPMGAEWLEVPSVTTVLDILTKGGGLINWGQSTGVNGPLELVKRGALAPLIDQANRCYVLGQRVAGVWQEATVQDVLELMDEHGITIDDAKESGGHRGDGVHRALETWCEQGSFPVPDLFPEEEQGYVEGLRQFLVAIHDDVIQDSIVSERMVGSIEHGFAGRYDLELALARDVEIVQRIYPKKPPKIGVMQAGRWRLDLKTSKHVYDSHFLQLEGYEGGAIECGYGPSDHRGVIHVTQDGRYELVESPADFEDFLAIREAYAALQRLKGWKKR